MSIMTTSGICEVCGRVIVQREKMNNLMHGIMFLCTCGLWGVVWGIALMTDPFGDWFCSKCGRKAKKVKG